jgi:hypothetical protein
MKPIALILALSCAALAQQEKPKANWERMKACAAQAEKAANRVGEKLIENHYSPKYQRCFMLTYSDLPANRLWDAFEMTELAVKIYDLTKEPSRFMCRLTMNAGPKSCSEVEAYIEERLTQ